MEGRRGAAGERQGQSPQRTSWSSSLHKKGAQDTDSKTGGDGGSTEEEGEAGEEEGRKEKNNNDTKECVIKTGNGRREEGSGGFEKRGWPGSLFQRAEEWGRYPSRLNGNQIIC